MALVSDDELADLALAADPDEPIPDDAVPFSAGGHDVGLLPAWYAPGGVLPSSPGRHRRAVVVALIIAALVVVNGAGLCVTYGLPEIAW